MKEFRLVSDVYDCMPCSETFLMKQNAKNSQNIRFQMQCGAKTFVANNLHVCALCALFSMTEPTRGKRKAIVFYSLGLNCTKLL